MAFGEIFKEIRLKNNDSLRGLGEKIDISFSYIDQIEKGLRPINKDILEKFIKVYPLYKKQLEKAYLDEIMPESLKGSTFNMEKQKVNTVILPVYGKASAGNGYINLDQEIYYFPIKKGDFSDRSFLVEINGNSMEPTLEDGDYALVDPDNIDYVKNKIYVVTYNDESFIKRMVVDNKSKIVMLKSDNPEYEDILITKDMQVYLKIEGRVIQVISNKYL
ncbi:LexA family transcriptional regulator [Fusobacterium vincentii]|uniref:XRE family transcriptional regulator n=1 Tax=Fusobacterium vincentii TaxID=155615 RepID=A0AAJ1CRX4_FUSVC|nr:XRE family transcriptional regulator [Fusobacterium vincentii]MCW0263094.1 XRE family transcriptional regulator [Fusobacterium vincentii]STO29926.1 LexA repressor [Fusobacterium vincentii]